MKRVAWQEITLKSAVGEIGLSYSQTSSCGALFEERGRRGLISKKRGRVSPNRLDPLLQNKVLALIRERYSDYGPTLISEKLIENHQLILPKESIRKWMITAGLWKPKRKIV